MLIVRPGHPDDLDALMALAANAVPVPVVSPTNCLEASGAGGGGAGALLPVVLAAVAMLASWELVARR